MTDKELADKIVALGVGRALSHDWWWTPISGEIAAQVVSLEQFVRDWRVAGACLKLWPTTINVEHLDMTLDEMLRDPRAINEACCEALS